MTIAALVVFAVLLLAWLMAPAERRRRSSAAVPQPVPELAAEAA